MLKMCCFSQLKPQWHHLCQRISMPLSYWNLISTWGLPFLQGNVVRDYSINLIYLNFFTSTTIRKQTKTNGNFCSLSMHTYAVMGVNTAFIQAALLSRAKVYTIVPAKLEARLDMIKGNFKLQLLPVQGVTKIASAVYVSFRHRATWTTFWNFVCLKLGFLP